MQNYLCYLQRCFCRNFVNKNKNKRGSLVVSVLFLLYGSTLNILFQIFIKFIREAAKKVLFLVARPLRPLLSPPSLGLVAIETFFLTLKKKKFPQWHTRLAPTPLLVASLNKMNNIQITLFFFFSAYNSSSPASIQPKINQLQLGQHAQTSDTLPKLQTFTCQVNILILAREK